MISMTKNRLGTLRCPVAAYEGSGAQAAFGAGTGVSWSQRHGQPGIARLRTTGLRNVSFGTVSLIPPYTVDNATRLSAARERSP